MTVEAYNQDETQRRQLPTYYYHTHFLEMLAFVRQHYAHVLDDAQREFMREFDALGFDAQCLYVRLVNRKGSLFALSRLRYPEIAGLSAAIDELERCNLLDAPSEAHAQEVLRYLTRAQLLSALRPRFVGMKTSMKKAELVAFARANLDDSELTALLPAHGVRVQGRADDVRFLLFLFFGRVQEGLSQFTMRDLGLVRTHHFGDSYEARFAERDEAVQSYFFANQLESLRDEERHDELLAGLEQWPDATEGLAANLRDKLAYQLGRAMEARGDTFAALRVYERGDSANCAERVIRLLLASGQREEARLRLEQSLADPSSDAEALLASDIYSRKFGGKRTSTLTDLLREAQTIDVDEAHTGAPERAAAAWFEARGERAFRTENSLWRTLFGLLFWDELFGSEASGVHSPFESLPGSLSERRFGVEFAGSIERKLDLLDDREAVRRQLLKTSVQHFGTANGVFRWRQRILDAVHAMLDVAHPAGMRQMLRRFCDNYPDSRYGYPDLMLVNGESLRFVEIKTDGDQLRRNQLLRIEQLREAGFDADVVRVRWVLDPQQVYVVVDVETTGGRGEQHRVTEIGAVKVVDGQLVDRFETLLNPQRGIPPGITRLTGITPAMVAGAPLFADVADEFAQFLDGAIFVAHNVEFDYRFIAKEFERLGRPFRMPKLCTCASMRKLYPGHKSYSLANLTATYDIKLRNHHRALCDAEAAAELLLLVNEKRQEALSETSSDEQAPLRAG